MSLGPVVVRRKRFGVIVFTFPKPPPPPKDPLATALAAAVVK